MSEVRRAWDEHLQRPVAVKIIRFNLLSRPDYLARFIEEAHLGSRLKHPGIIPVFDLGQLPDGRFFFTMPVVRGTTLKKVIAEVHDASGERTWRPSASAWTFRRLIIAFRHVCEAIAYAHDRGVIHRDIKPSNVMVSDTNKVFVVDWGLAKVLGESPVTPVPGVSVPVVSRRSRCGSEHDASGLHTQAGARVGTPAYMSPEQVSGTTSTVDTASDVYALGGMLYQLLSGRPPYVGENARAVMEMVRNVPPAPLSVTCSLPIPRELVEMCEKAMARSPDDRYAGASAIARETNAWLSGGWRDGQPQSVMYKPIVFNSDHWTTPPKTDTWFGSS